MSEINGKCINKIKNQTCKYTEVALIVMSIIKSYRTC